ncbi:outer membrane beta-barrel protein [Sphingobium bisphenolivorans]|uniref:outer membrane beta-barrel protein n=1 Tax=Sphingobium bisphenolivorans TaxID=1335760 RepID=UPI0003B2E265|nr:outer membrane beta-barrel protein [Sphingobium bisphenolivorans]
MVLMPRFLLSIGSCAALAAAVPAFAQQLDRATPLIEAPGEYDARSIQLGRVAAAFGGDVRLEYDSNIYALPSDEIHDVRAVFSPWINLGMKDDKVDLGLQARAVVRRYFDRKTENSEAGTVNLKGSYQFSNADSLSANLGWMRVVEERGEPEGLTTVGISPRKYDQFRSELGYSHQGAKINLGLKGSALRNNALRASDADRDYWQYGGVGRVGYRVSGIVSAFGELFLTARDFRLGDDPSALNRDSKTYGARGGVAFQPGGLIQGEAAVGVFRFNPDDRRLRSRSGLSVSAGLTYTPTPRVVVTLDGFRGDVATVRAGAQGRTDTRFQLGLQNEIYHNLRWQGAVIYRRSVFIGAGQKERTIAGLVELEYLLSRNIAFALTGRLANRESSEPLDDFDRSILGAEVRLQY